MSATVFHAGSPYEETIFVLLEQYRPGTRLVQYFDNLEAVEDQVALLGARSVLLHSSNGRELGAKFMTTREFVRQYLRGSTDRRRKPAGLYAVSPSGFNWPDNWNDISDHLRVFAGTCTLFDKSGLDHLVKQREKGVFVLGDPSLHGPFVNKFGIYTPNEDAGKKTHVSDHRYRLVLRSPKFAKAAAAAQAKALAAAPPPKRSSRLQATPATPLQVPVSVGALAGEAAPAPVAAPSLYEGIGTGRRGTSQVTTLEKITFTRENLETAEKQKLLTETLEKFLRAVEADPTTQFPFKRSKEGGPLNEAKVVADFLNAGKHGVKKKKAEEMLRAVCKLRGVTSEYFEE